MAKVSVGLGMTLKLASGGGFNMFKPEILISDIDLDSDVSPDAQVDAAMEHVRTIYQQVEVGMSEIIENSEIEEKREVVTELSKVSQDLAVRVRKLELGTSAVEEKVSVAPIEADDDDKHHGW